MGANPGMEAKTEQKFLPGFELPTGIEIARPQLRIVSRGAITLPRLTEPKHLTVESDALRIIPCTTKTKPTPSPK